MSEKKSPKWWVRVLRSAAAVLLGVFLLLVVFVMFFENSMIYFPSGEGDWDQVTRRGTEVHFQAADGVKLHGAVFGEGKKTLLFFHGNAGNLADRTGYMLDLARELHVRVFIFDYRGYGKSEGKPNETGIYADGEAAYRWLIDGGTAAEDILLYGNSLGGAVAAETAVRVKCGGLILQSSFTSAKDMAGVMMPFVPARWFLRHKLDTLSKVSKIEEPKLIIHSRDDEMIPYWMGEKIHEAASDPKTLLELTGAGHNDVNYSRRDEVIGAIRSFMGR